MSAGPKDHRATTGWTGEVGLKLVVLLDQSSICAGLILAHQTGSPASILKCRSWPETGQVSIGGEASCALLDWSTSSAMSPASSRATAGVVNRRGEWVRSGLPHAYRPSHTIRQSIGHDGAQTISASILGKGNEILR
jgi:hypothetical protein